MNHSESVFVEVPIDVRLQRGVFRERLVALGARERLVPAMDRHHVLLLALPEVEVKR